MSSDVISPIVDCAPNYYGDHCNISCSNHCQNNLCDQTTGYCFSCIPSRFGVFCENQAIIDNVAGKESIECKIYRNMFLFLNLNYTDSGFNNLTHLTSLFGWLILFFFFEASFDSNSNAGFIATSVIMVILLTGIIVYIVKQKWHSNTTQSSGLNSEF